MHMIYESATALTKAYCMQGVRLGTKESMMFADFWPKKCSRASPPPIWGAPKRHEGLVGGYGSGLVTGWDYLSTPIYTNSNDIRRQP